MTPLEELEHILAARDFGPQHHPQLFRLLREAELVFLVPYHPEIMGDVTIQAGDPMPKFMLLQSPGQGTRIAIFSSMKCANEACKKLGIPDGQFALCLMIGKGLFDMIRHQTHAIVINPACHTNALFLDLNGVKMLADGSILAPETGENRRGTVQIVPPAEYPTDFLQPLFVFLRGRPEVKAAWLFREVQPKEGGIHYVFILKMVGPDTGVLQDFRIIANSSRPKGADYGVTLFDPNHAELVKITSAHTPFYAAPDYPAPGPLRDEGTGKA
jgi:hypothetical protein